jgi:hypothetical protein
MIQDMGGNADGLRSLVKYSKLPAERIKYVADANEDTVRSINRGILFLMAFWSGPSVIAFAKLTDVLATLKADELELVVVDVDGSPDLYELPELKGQVSGSGETAWVRNGKIVNTSGRGLNVESFNPNTLALLAMP